MTLTMAEDAALVDLHRWGEVDIDLHPDRLWLHLNGIAGLLVKRLAEIGSLVVKDAATGACLRAHARRIVVSDAGRAYIEKKSTQ